MTIFRTAMLAWTLLAPAAAQTPLDFTGRWLRVEVSGVTGGWDVADEITIAEVADPGPSGAPVPVGRQLRVERLTGGEVREETLMLGTGGVVAGQSADGVSTTRLIKSEWAVQVRDGRLLQWRSETSREPDGTAQVSERAQEWSLDAEGRLVIAVRTRAPGEDSRRGRMIYRRAERP